MPTKKKSTVSQASRVVAYVRVSTDKQATEGLSLEAQHEKLVSYAKALGLEIVSFCSDAASASSLDRPGLTEALAHLDDGYADGILVVKLDRLTRSIGDLVVLVDEYFKDDHWLLSVSESIDTRSAAGRMMINMLTVIGQWEREAIGERTAAVMQHMKAEGMFTGGFPPYGYRLEGDKLVVDDGERVLRYHAQKRRRDGLSLRAIAKELGINQRTGKPFAASQIARML